MNNAFLQDYLQENYGADTAPFDAKSYAEKTQSRIANIQSEIDGYDQERLAKDASLFIIDQEIQNKQKQISSLKIFIEQKSKIASLQASLGKLQEQLEQLEKDRSTLETSKTPIIEEINQINISMKLLEDKKSELAESLHPDFHDLQLGAYIYAKKQQMIELFLANEQRREKQRIVLGTQFESETKEQYPFDNFQNNPEVLDGLHTMFDDEKKEYIEMYMHFFRAEHTNALINNFQSLVQKYEADSGVQAPTRSIEDVELNVDYKELDSIYKDILDANRQFFPHLKAITDILAHPLFKRKGDVSFDQIEKYCSGISRKADAKKFNDLNMMLNTIILDYNLPLSKIAKEVEHTKSEAEWNSIMDNEGMRGKYAKYILIDKEVIKQLQRIVNLFNERKTISFKGSEEIITTIDGLLRSFLQDTSGSLYAKLNTLSSQHTDEFADLINAMLSLVEKNNLNKDVGQQIMMFQNIIWTIAGYFRRTYAEQDTGVIHSFEDFMDYIVSVMYMETLSKDIIDDTEQKHQLFSLYNDVFGVLNYTLGPTEKLEDEKKNFKRNNKLATEEDRNARVFSLVDMLTELKNFVIRKNMYDISNNLFQENSVSEGDRKACADLYTVSSGFKAPGIDPILISPDSFGIKNAEYMLESYDLSKTENYFAYIRMFNISDLKNYEKIKAIIASSGPELPEETKTNIILNLLAHKDQDFICVGKLLPEFTPLFIHKNFDISLDGINGEGLKYIIGDKPYEMLRTYLYYTFMEANREHEYLITTPKELISPAVPNQKALEEGLKIITINPDMPRTVSVARHTGMTKNFEYKRECMVLLNPKCTTGLSGFTEAKNHNKELYAYVHKRTTYPTRENCIEKIRLDTCESYEAFLEAFEAFRKKHDVSTELVVRVETYRSEFEKYEGAKEKTIYKIAETKNAPKKILGGKKGKTGGKDNEHTK